MNEELTPKEYWNDVADDKEFTTPFQIDLFSKYVDKNAVSELKEKADFITKSNNEDGVAFYLEKLF